MHPNSTTTPVRPTEYDHRLAAKAHRVYAAASARAWLRGELDQLDDDALAVVMDAADQVEVKAEARALLREREWRQWADEERRADEAALTAARQATLGPTYAEVMLSRYGARV